MLDPIWDPQFASDREQRLTCARWGLILKSYKINRMWPDRPNYQIEHTMMLRDKWLDLAGHPTLAFALAYLKYIAWVVSIEPVLGEVIVIRGMYRDFLAGVLPTRVEVSA